MGADIIGTTAMQDLSGFDAWSLPYTVISDSSNELSSLWGFILTDNKDGRDGYCAACGVKAGDPNVADIAQPGVTVYHKGEIIYNWFLVPNDANLGGALDRPKPAEIVAHVKAKIDGQDTTEPQPDIEGQNAAIRAMKGTEDMGPLYDMIVGTGRKLE